MPARATSSLSSSRPTNSSRRRCAAASSAPPARTPASRITTSPRSYITRATTTRSSASFPGDTYASVEVDKEWDIFTAYRAIYGIDLTDLTRHIKTETHDAATDCEVAFFPGCSLAAYAPDLTREIFETLDELGGKTTMIDHCCGSPLKSAGFFDRAEALCDRSCAEIASSGAHALVCVCPGCKNAMQAALDRNGMDVRAVSLSAFLLEHGFTPKHPLPEGSYCMSKACQDRDGSCLDATLEVLGLDGDTVEIFHGAAAPAERSTRSSPTAWTARPR